MGASGWPCANTTGATCVAPCDTPVRALLCVSSRWRAPCIPQGAAGGKGSSGTGRSFGGGFIGDGGGRGGNAHQKHGGGGAGGGGAGGYGGRGGDATDK